jgi:hypothetical protein
MLIGRWHLARLATCTVLALAVIGILVASASADVHFGYDKAFGPGGTEASEFAAAGSVAIDREEEVAYVLDRAGDALFKFDLEGHPVNFGGSSPDVSGNELSGLSIGGSQGERQVAVNSATHIIYLTGEAVEERATALQAFEADGDPSIFGATGTNKITGFVSLQGVAVDQNNDIYVADASLAGNGVQVYDPSGTVIVPSLGVTGPGAPANLAVDSNGTLYVLRNFLEVAKYTPSEYPVTPTTKYTPAPELVDPNQAHGIGVDPVTNYLYVSEMNTRRIAVFDEGGVEQGTFGGPGDDGELGSPDGVAALTIDNQALSFVADSPDGGPSFVKIFEEGICICPPAIESTAVADVTADSATLRATINPNNLDTTYWFEYGTSDCSVNPCEKVPAPAVPIGSGKKAVVVEQPIDGLQPDTTYFFRAMAENGEGPAVEGVVSKTFVTQGLDLSFGLSDARVWEMVSPVKKFGGTIVNTESTVIQASVTEDKIAYASFGSIVSNPQSNRVPEPATNLAKRSATGEWVTGDLTPPHKEASQFLHGQTEFKVFTPNLLQAEMEPFDDFPLSPDASERTPYLWSDGNPALFTPLVNPSNVPPGTKFGAVPGIANPIRIEGATSDLSHIVLRSTSAPLVAGAEPESIYLWSNGTLEPVSEMPAGGGAVKGMLGSGQGSVRHAISNDGTRAFWTPSTAYNGTDFTLPSLYIRDTVLGESVRLDVPRLDASGSGPERPAFSGASADGNVAFFTDSHQLTADASPSGRDLYRCEIGPVVESSGCTELTNVSPPIEGSGESAEVLDMIPALSEDGTRLFVVARGVLDEGANEEGETATAGAPNLYFWQEGKSPRYIATLSENDQLVWGKVGARGYTVNISATVSPDGRYFAFTSENGLTGYENRSSSGDSNTEVFLYDVEADSHQLTCLSCNPSGAAAIGEERPAKEAFFPPDRGGLWANRWVAGTLAGASQAEPAGPSLYRPRSVLNNGRVFFNAVDPLVQRDSNGKWDVYQYEPVGVGTCTTATSSAGMTRSGNGCVGLVSSGTSKGNAGFLDATPNGDNAFFLTGGQLSPLDQDDEIDVYDARVNGIAVLPESVQECAGAACQESVAAPPVDPAPASQQFSGNGTPLRCRKNQRKVRRHGKNVCVSKKKHHKKKHKPASKNRRASR